MKNSVAITGVSSGIGFDAARTLISRGYHVFGSVRKAADAERVRTALGSDFTPLLFDVTDQSAIDAAVDQVRAQLDGRGLTALVNNSGIAPSGPLMHAPLDEVRNVFEVNVFGVVAVTQGFLPLLGASREAPFAPGRIINVSSISGRLTFPFTGAYSASKHALESVTDAFRRELSIYGIEVIAIEPGPIRTSIWDKFDDSRIDMRYADTDYAAVLATLPALMAEEARKADPVERVSRTICEAIETPRPKTRYPLEQPLWLLKTWLSDRVMDRVISRKMGLQAAFRRP
ncbi:hypothetical protein R75461_05957 [Paraburkholderia nemoris]|nr:SDR family oxidoreductase [Paraburkholderia aspalathi]CAE6817821.1 hypothetical protein R75461_05957 [Paraburkholderia nemoris]